ncbi:hypothetical protein [Methylobacterium fujisawaense]|uniref:hypothetical protein n=1 Tax=Methylobacterium fujisawaense TaxID=107400 RepID=UPI00244C7DDD|nr:hypothetical protein [Methylobacterium fujisawaense]MDH3029682.1 hypothetical protein [Methylobacterium fujisawaense]
MAWAEAQQWMSRNAECYFLSIIAEQIPPPLRIWVASAERVDIFSAARHHCPDVRRKLVRRTSWNESGLGDEMVVAALLFLVGALIGRSYSVMIIAMTSSVVMFTAMTIFMSVYGLDLLHVLIMLGYLTAHQAGYLLGAYLTNYPENNRGL